MDGDIIACYATTWVSKIIQLISGKSITHVAIQITDTLIMEASWFGIKLSKLCQYNGKYETYTCNSLTKEQRNSIVKYVLNRVDEPYDYPLLFGMAINIILKKLKIHTVKTIWDDPAKNICIELVIEAYRNIGLELLPEYNDYDIEPGDIVNSSLLKRVSI